MPLVQWWGALVVFCFLFSVLTLLTLRRTPSQQIPNCTEDARNTYQRHFSPCQGEGISEVSVSYDSSKNVSGLPYSAEWTPTALSLGVSTPEESCVALSSFASYVGTNSSVDKLHISPGIGLTTLGTLAMPAGSRSATS